MGTYVFEAEMEQDDDGRWGADIPLLPGCNAWGYSREEALGALREVAQAFVEIMLENGERVPAEGDVRVGSDRETIISVVVPAATTA